MAIYGYARVSSAQQDLNIQIDTLKAAGAEIVRSEKVSGTSTKGRHELSTLLEFLRDGDTLLITRIDRLARSVCDLHDIVRDLQKRGVELKATEQPIDTSSSAGAAFVSMLSVFSEFETSLRSERQAQGIARAKAEGRYKGRKATINTKEIKRLKLEEGFGASAIAKQLGISRASVYRALG